MPYKDPNAQLEYSNKYRRDRYRDDPEYREKVLGRSRKYQEENPDKVRNRSRTYHEENREKERNAQALRRANNLEKSREYDREWARTNRAANPEKEHAFKIKQKYGLTSNQYDSILRAQSGTCAICLKPCLTGRRLAVDHDHSCCPGETSCGKCIRGLLSASCNFFVGRLEKDPARLQATLAYLERHKGEE